MNADMPMWLIKQRAKCSAQKAPLALLQFRERHWQTFLQIGLPKEREERWKYADLSFLQNAFVSAETNMHDNVNKAETKTHNTPDNVNEIVNEYRKQHPGALICVILNGRYEKKYSDIQKIPAEMTICSWHDAFEDYADFINQNKHDYSFASLNAALSDDGLFVRLPDHFKLEQALHILSLTACGATVLNPSHCIILGKNAQLTLIEHYQSIASHQYLLNTVLHAEVDEGAKLTHYKFQNENPHACHIAHTFIRQEKDSDVECASFSFGGYFSRDELAIFLRGVGASSKATGFYVLKQDDQYIDHHVDIEHHAAHTSSEMFYKGIVKDKACAVFNGRLYVNKDAQKITAYQANHNLLLSNRAHVYSKPELEIYADDVKCKHGATIGQLDQDALYYLRSRGICRDDAIGILLKGFAEEIFKRVSLSDIKRRLQQMVLSYEN